jgi:hypothetical protein
MVIVVCHDLERENSAIPSVKLTTQYVCFLGVSYRCCNVSNESAARVVAEEIWESLSEHEQPLTRPGCSL